MSCKQIHTANTFNMLPPPFPACKIIRQTLLLKQIHTKSKAMPKPITSIPHTSCLPHSTSSTLLFPSPISIPHLKHPCFLTRRKRGIASIIRVIHIIMYVIQPGCVRAGVLGCGAPGCGDLLDRGVGYGVASPNHANLASVFLVRE